MNGEEDPKRWRAVVADMQRQIEKVMEIGNADLVEWVAAAIWDCVLDFRAGRMPEASRVMTMRLTPHFSRVKANGAFMHEEGMNLPPQGETELEDRQYSSEEVRELFQKHHMQEPMTYQGDQYFFTGKIGKSFKDPKVISFEYSDYGEDIEQRIWVNTKGEITPD